MPDTRLPQLRAGGNSRKSVRWSAVPMPCLSRLWLKLRGEQGSGPEGVDDLCFHTYGEFSPPPPPPSSSPSPPPHPPSPKPRGPYPSLEAEIWAWRLEEGVCGGEEEGKNSPYV